MYIEADKLSNGIAETDTFYVTYDNNNRITALTGTQLKEVYTYQSSKTFTFDLYAYNQLNVHEIFYLNSASVVDSTLQYDNTNDTTTEGYVYNGSLLAAKLTYDYSTYGTYIDFRDDYSYDNNGNLLKDTQSDGYGDVSQVSAFTYTTHPLSVTINPTYQPVQAKFLPATQTLTDGSGNHLGTVTYTYTFDSSGRLTQETDAADNGDVSVKSYVYE